MYYIFLLTIVSICMVKNAIEMGFHVNFFIYYVKKIKNDQHRTRVLRQLGINYYLLLLKKKQTSKTFFFE